MGFIDAVVLGVVEGITEFLPISSTGHLILVSNLLRLPETDFLKTFQVAIQLGAILAVVMLYWRRFLFDRTLIQKLMVALIPALLVGYLLYAAIKQLFGSSTVVVGALFVGGLVLIAFELFRGEQSESGSSLDELSYRAAFGIGCFQVLAVIPGVSRAGATFVGGLLLGLKRTAVVEFSFLLAVPTMLAATVLDLWKHSADFSLGNFELLIVGFLVSFVIAWCAVKFLLRFVENHTFITFGVYRILLAGAYYLFVLR